MSKLRVSPKLLFGLKSLLHSLYIYMHCCCGANNNNAMCFIPCSQHVTIVSCGISRFPTVESTGRRRKKRRRGRLVA